MKKLILLVVLVQFFAISSKSTPQTKDILIWNNDTLEIYDSPWLQLNYSTSLGSYCWRGYKAIWYIYDNQLYLGKVQDCDSRQFKDSIVEISYQKKYKNGLIKADWVSEIFWAGKDEAITYGANYYSKDYCLTFNKGNLISVESRQSPPCIYDTQHEIYQYLFENIGKDSNLVSLPDFYGHLFIQSDSFGNVIDVEIESTYDSIPRKEIQELFLTLPCRTVYFHKRSYVNYTESYVLDINSKTKYRYGNTINQSGVFGKYHWDTFSDDGQSLELFEDFTYEHRNWDAWPAPFITKGSWILKDTIIYLNSYKQKDPKADTSCIVRKKIKKKQDYLTIRVVNQNNKIMKKVNCLILSKDSLIDYSCQDTCELNYLQYKDHKIVRLIVSEFSYQGIYMELNTQEYNKLKIQLFPEDYAIYYNQHAFAIKENRLEEISGPRRKFKKLLFY